MSQRKRKILVVTESKFISSGFGTYGKELLKRLYDTQLFEIAEFSCYSNNLQYGPTEWLVYCNGPVPGEQPYEQQHNENPVVQWGVSRFDLACLDFQPDIVLTYRDPWMDAYIADSPFLPFFHWVWMPTVDSEPQKPEWLYNLFNRCDGLLAYSEFGIKTLQKQTHGRLKVFGCGTPGVDKNEFFIINNKDVHKEKYGIPGDSFVVGTVMRNQKRKMFAELMRTFKMFLSRISESLANKCYLYLHTSHPEKMGWNITELVHEFDLGSRLICTYSCQHCKKYFVSVYRDAITLCNHCGAHAASLPGVANGLDHSELVNIYNLMDLYVQYAICEGLGMPQIEAAACGVRVAAVNYSAMEDVIKNTDGIAIPAILERELETNADRSRADNEYLSEVLVQVATNNFQNNNDYKNRQREKIREKCFKRYSWDITIDTWISYLQQAKLKDMAWQSPPLINPLPTSIPQGLNHLQFCEWLFNNLVQDKYHLFNYKMMTTLKYLNYGAVANFGVLHPYNQETAYNEYKPLAERRFTLDAIRTRRMPMNPQKFIIEARQRLKQS